MKFMLTVEFKVEPVTIVVVAPSMRQAWANRFDLAALAVPSAWEGHPRHITAIEPEPA